METLEQRCTAWISEEMRPALESKTAIILGPRPGGRPWLELLQDPASHSPVLYFHYPTAIPAGADYIRRAVKLEFGSLTDQRPTGRHTVRPWLADLLPKVGGCEVVALELERAFWEKATILHAEHHRDAASPMPDRYSRHYADLAALAFRPEIKAVAADSALCQRVVDWKAKFFARSWARYDLAVPGTFRLLPPDTRRTELALDYAEMRQMFIGEPLAFEAVMTALAGLEGVINARR